MSGDVLADFAQLLANDPTGAFATILKQEERIERAEAACREVVRLALEECEAWGYTTFLEAVLAAARKGAGE